MSDHTEVRLETLDGTPIAYLAPNAETTPVLDNELFSASPGRGDPAIVRDIQKLTFELTAQGQFMHSEELPDPHRTALEDLFESVPVTAMDQINRVVHYVHDPWEGGPFQFFWRGNEFTATSPGDVDYQDGVYPVVNVDQFRPPTRGGFARGEYTLKLAVGVERT
jgi:hypothetical protein